MHTEKKIAIIICYSGKLPWYFNYFVHSCGYNPTIDFYIITDDTVYQKPVPNNVKFIYKTLGEISDLATEKLGFPIKIEYGYKLCDFKPAYGILFPEIIEGYDFWGQGDIDVIYGDIRNFLTEDMLEKFDYISMRHDYTTGCFSLFRNNSTINNIFKRSRDYKKIFSSSIHFCFDECNHVHDLLTEGKSIFEIETEIESFMHVIKSAENDNEIKAHFDFILMEGVTGKVKFDQGKIIYKNQFEAILYHLYWLKRIYNPKSVPDNIPSTYHISPTKIYYKKAKKAKDLLKV